MELGGGLDGARTRGVDAWGGDFSIMEEIFSSPLSSPYSSPPSPLPTPLGSGRRYGKDDDDDGGSPLRTVDPSTPPS